MKWKKKGRIFDPTGRHRWMMTHAQVPFPLEFDDFVRIYFATREGYDVNGQCRSFGGYVDVDKNDFTRIIRVSEVPVLPLGEIGEFDEFGSMPVSVIRRDDNLFYMYYAGWTRAVSTPHRESIGLAVSTDGAHFKKYAPGPLIGDSLWEPYLHSCPVVYFIEDMYHMFYTSGIKWMEGIDRRETQYVIRHAVSTDGIEWSRDYKDIIPTKLENECQNSPTILRNNNSWHMYYCYRCGLDFRDKKGRGYMIGHAVSNDLFNWERCDDEAGIGLAESGWDSEMISYPNISTIGGKVYMFYCGNFFGKEGFGYAELIDYTSQGGADTVI